MSTFRLPILGPMTRLDDSGDVFFKSTLLGGTNVDEFTITFAPPSGADIQIFGNFFVPKNYSSATTDPTIKVVWFSDDITPSGSAGWEFKYMAVADGESYNSTFLETKTVLTALSGTWLFQQTSSMTLARANLVVDDDIRFTLSRDDSTDTATNNLRLRGLFLEYQDA